MVAVKPLPTPEEIAEWYRNQVSNAVGGKFDGDVLESLKRVIERAAYHAANLKSPLVGSFVLEYDKDGVASIFDVAEGDSLDMLYHAYEWAEMDRDIAVYIKDATENVTIIRAQGTPHFSPAQALDALNEGKKEIGSWKIDWNYQPGSDQVHDGTPITTPKDGRNDGFLCSGDLGDQVTEATTWIAM